MKTMTCKDMGGPCDAEISAETFAELAEKGKAHVHEQAEEVGHAELVEKMKAITPEEYDKWEEGTKAKFDALPDA